MPKKRLDIGVKHDSEKPRVDLIPPIAITEIARVLAHGAGKYDDDNWRIVADGKRRYYAAAMRLMLARWDGERLDAESGLPHLAHAACCICFLVWIDRDG